MKHKHYDVSFKDIPKDTLKKLFKYITKNRKFLLTVIVFCILLSSLFSAYGMTLYGKVVDEAISPFIGKAGSYTKLATIIVQIILVFGLSVFTNYIYNYLIIIVSQKTLKNIRDDMFKHMQKLPIKYFDTNSHGNIMSRYTNDTDTLRQMISSGLPNIISSISTIISVFIFMIINSYLLTLFVICFVIFMLFVTKKLASHSSKYFINHQETLGNLNGYIEEMINGTKVVKVFNHEDKCIEEFSKINEDACFYATKAHIFSNVFMPVMVQLGNLQYALIAMIGGIMAINGYMGLSLGTILAFLTLSKNFSSSIGLVSNQINSIIAALAGSKRIFELLDEEVEIDEGQATLVNVKKKIKGLKEVNYNTNLWAWKINGELILLKGDVRFHDVNFSYDGKKQILKNIDFYAKPGQKIALV